MDLRQTNFCFSPWIVVLSIEEAKAAIGTDFFSEVCWAENAKRFEC